MGFRAQASGPNRDSFRRFHEANRSQAEALRRLAEWLDTAYRLPLGIRVGWDGILGLIPGLGDLVTNGLSLYILLQAAMLGCPPSVLARMAGNLFLDNLLDSIPFLGNFFDLFWRANLRNAALLEAYLAQPERTRRRSWWTLFFMLGFLGLVTIGLAVLTLTGLIWTLEWLSRQPWQRIW